MPDAATRTTTTPSAADLQRAIAETRDGIARKEGGCLVWEPEVPEHDGSEGADNLPRHLATGSNGRLRDLFADFGQRAAEAVHDPDLNDEARVRRLREVTESVVGEIAQIPAGQPGPGQHDHTRAAALHVGQARGSAATIRGQIAKALEVDSTDAAAAVRQMEIRRHLADLPEHDRAMAISRAIQSADVETLRAVTTAPGSIALGSDGEIAEVQKALERAVAPDDLRRAEELEKRLGSVERNSRNVGRRIQDIAQDLAHGLGGRLDLGDFG